MINLLSSPVLISVVFSANTSEFGGGGMYNANSSPSLTNIAFSTNTARLFGGGMINVTIGTNPTLTNVTFSANSAPDGGGILNDSDSSANLTNAAFWGNLGTGPDVALGSNGTNTAMIANSCSEQDLITDFTARPQREN